MRVSEWNRGTTKRAGKREWRDRRAVSAFAGIAALWKGGRRSDGRFQRARQASPAAVRVASAPALILPSLARVPAGFGIVSGESALPAIASALLDAGVLVSSDWNGNLRESVEGGFARWLNARGWDGMEHLELTAWISDDVEEMEDYLSNSHSWSRRYGNDGKVVGGFGLYTQSYAKVSLETRLTELEALQTGCGVSVLTVVERALQDTIGVFSPRLAMDFAESWQTGWDDLEDEAKAEDGQSAVDALNQSVPPQIILPAFVRGAIEKGRARGKESRGKREILKKALWLWGRGEGIRARAQASQKPFNDLPYLCEGETVLPVCLRWNDADAMLRLWDDWEHLFFQSERTFNCFCAAFQVGEASLPDAIGRFTECVDLLIAADKILDWFYGPTRLMEVFAREEAAQAGRGAE